jgi:hypothetical protein
MDMPSHDDAAPMRRPALPALPSGPEEREALTPVPEALTPEAVAEQIALIQRVMREAMREGEHYGTVPGCGPKPTLLKPGAEKLSLTFRLAPRYTVNRHDLPGGHREYEVLCELVHVPTGRFAGQGVGLCSTMESKYRYRKASRRCPACGAEAIVKGRAEYGGGWICFKKKNGCGAKFADGDEAIASQPEGRVENEDLADSYNTVLKLAKKRAHVDAILTATAASDLFVQDVEDGPRAVEAATAPAFEGRVEGLRRWLSARPDRTVEALESAEAKVAAWPEPHRSHARALLDAARRAA